MVTYFKRPRPAPVALSSEVRLLFVLSILQELQSHSSLGPSGGVSHCPSKAHWDRSFRRAILYDKAFPLLLG